jgi:rfaE bifunctional protein nucleotidyltransferase chain/domain/rfaE bifunctional protein kinase chain/domain
VSRLVVVGDTLLDRDLVGTVQRLCPDAPAPVVDEPVEVDRPGGAGLAALLSARDGRDVTLVTAVCDDAPGQRVRELLQDAGVEVLELSATGSTVEKVRVRADGRSLVRLDRGSASVTGDLQGTLPDGVVLVADYGRGVTLRPLLREALAHRRVVWDPHPRGAVPVPACVLATPNVKEAVGLAGRTRATGLRAVVSSARALREQWRAGAVAVTMGEQGALLVQADGTPSVFPAPAVPCFDPCGAGDRFASAAAGLLADGALVSEAVAGAVTAAADFVGRGGAAAVPVPLEVPDGASDPLARTRAAGGTVVATGGCFDLLHAGHVSVLLQARALGDCLVVLLNSDASVRRLKGPARPIQPQADRARVLAALSCVDEVVVFDEDTPAAALERLRPDVWAKGGDYAGAHLPEAEVLDRWGGQVVALPYLEGRSTSFLIREVVARA